MKMDYLLDNLGWYDFEELVQTLLKVRLGMGVEAWGGRGDWGRDAFCSDELRYPTTELATGPFLFQAKFVESANAAGARPEPLVINAVRQECAQISKRLEPGGVWKESPAHYALFTNAPLTPATRSTIDSLIGRVLPNTRQHIHDGHDICQWLNVDRTIVRAFPQLMSIRDLEEFLRLCVNSEILSRSETAIDMARAESKVFVPTESYFEALNVLKEKSFVVLEGPPEMGKTTVGRIISLSQMSRGWEAIECRGPEDFLTTHQKHLSQVFVADDFFGRTEYDPARVSRWQAELPHILRRLDGNHWLILTSRAHLLEMAKANLDVAGQDGEFPDLGEVVVDAGDLTNLEKARLLYRHAKSAQFDMAAKDLIRRNARQIVSNKHFTPERIRSLITSIIPTMLGSGAHTPKELSALISEAITNPTKRMRSSFRALPVCHRWLLYSLLCDNGLGGLLHPRTGVKEPSLRDYYESLCPVEHQRPFEQVTKELTEGFVTDQRHWFGEQYIGWIHPSCRDLAIDELSANPMDRQRFLRSCSEVGIALATSVGGGQKGSRTLPLLLSERDWELLAERALGLVAYRATVFTVLWANLQAIEGRSGAGPDQVLAGTRLRKLTMESILPIALKRVEESRYICSLDELEILLRARAQEKLDVSINLESVWQEHVEEAKLSLTDDAIWQLASGPARFLRFVQLVERYAPELFFHEWARTTLQDVIDSFARRGDAESHTSYYGDHSIDELSEVVDGYQQLSKSYTGLADLGYLGDEQRVMLRQASAHFKREANSHEEEIPPEPEYQGDELPSRLRPGPDVDTLFRDL